MTDGSRQVITENAVEKALTFLVETAPLLGQLVEQARMKESMVKHVEALLIKSYDNGKLPITLRQPYARAEERYLEAAAEDAKAAGALAELRARRDAAETTISVYQSMVKDRQGARP
jgi:hypothetical protein